DTPHDLNDLQHRIRLTHSLTDLVHIRPYPLKERMLRDFVKRSEFLERVRSQDKLLLFHNAFWFCLQLAGPPSLRDPYFFDRPPCKSARSRVNDGVSDAGTWHLSTHINAA